LAKGGGSAAGYFFPTAQKRLIGVWLLLLFRSREQG
jgi:hypothetical protein